MAKAKSNPASTRAAATPPGVARPWLKAYPKDVDWGMTFEPALISSMLDASVEAFGSRPCTYFMGKRLSFAEIGQLSDRAAKGLEALGVGEGVKLSLIHI